MIETVFSNPAYVVGLTAIMILFVWWQKQLTYREFRFAHIAKCYLFAALDSWGRKHGRPLIRTKNYQDESSDFITTIEHTPRKVSNVLRESGFSPHLVATAKRRNTRDGLQWSHSQWVYIHDNGTQTECYLFSDGENTDVYAHVETAVTDPKGHLQDRQYSGDTKYAVSPALDKL